MYSNVIIYYFSAVAKNTFPSVDEIAQEKLIRATIGVKFNNIAAKGKVEIRFLKPNVDHQIIFN